MDLTGLHPAVLEKLECFDYGHLPQHLQDVSKPFHDVAYEMAYLPGPQVSIGLQKLIEAKDCMVRAAVKKHKQQN